MCPCWFYGRSITGRIVSKWMFRLYFHLPRNVFFLIFPCWFLRDFVPAGKNNAYVDGVRLLAVRFGRAVWWAWSQQCCTPPSAASRGRPDSSSSSRPTVGRHPHPQSAIPFPPPRLPRLNGYEAESNVPFRTAPVVESREVWQPCRPFLGIWLRHERQVSCKRDPLANSRVSEQESMYGRRAGSLRLTEAHARLWLGTVSCFAGCPFQSCKSSALTHWRLTCHINHQQRCGKQVIRLLVSCQSWPGLSNTHGLARVRQAIHDVSLQGWPGRAGGRMLQMRFNHQTGHLHSGMNHNAHLLKNMFDFALLVLKNIYHYWKYVFAFGRGLQQKDIV